MALSSRSLRNTVRPLLVLTLAMLALLAAASTAQAAEGPPIYDGPCGEYEGECEQKPVEDACPDALNPGTQNPGTPCLTEQPTPAPAPAPVDACPDEALNPGLQAPGTECLVELGPAAAFDDQEYATLGNAAVSGDPVDAGVEYELTAAGSGADVAPAAAPAASGTLPVTGSEVLLAAIAGVVLLWLGGAAYLAATVRRTSRATA